MVREDDHPRGRPHHQQIQEEDVQKKILMNQPAKLGTLQYHVCKVME